MNKLTRSLLSGASFAVLAVGLPQTVDIAQAKTVGGGGNGTTLNSATSIINITSDQTDDVILNGTVTGGAITIFGTHWAGVEVYTSVTISGVLKNSGIINVTDSAANVKEVDGILIYNAEGATGGYVLDGGTINISVQGAPSVVAGMALLIDGASEVTIDPGHMNINWHGAATTVGKSTTGEGAHILTCGEGASGTACAKGAASVGQGVNPTTGGYGNPELPGGEGFPQYPNGFPDPDTTPDALANNASLHAGFNPDALQSHNPLANPIHDPVVYGIADFYNGSHILNVSTNIGIGVSLTAAAQTLQVYGVFASRTAGVGNVSLNVTETVGEVISVAGRVNAITGTVTVQGVHLSAVSGTFVSATVKNAGSIHAVAHAGTCTTLGFCWGLGQEDAQATGVQLQAGFALSANAHVVNTGNIIATASVTGGSNFFWFGTGNHATAIGVEETVGFASAAWAGVDNNAGGKISANAFAFGTSVMTANAAGVLQNAFSAGFASLTVHNDGNINVLASAAGSGFLGVSNASINANALGISQSILFVNTANNSVVNSASGHINVTANANAFFAGVAFAGAHASGIQQFGFATSSSAHNVVHNTGAISVNANATASFAVTAVAVAGALGINQVAIAPSSARNDLHNNGLIDIGANASAAFDTIGIAVAQVSIGINQVALAFSTANNHLTNGPTTGGLGGTINIDAHALAFGTSVAVAVAAVGTTVLGFSVAGIQQFALASTLAHNTITNNGSIDIGAEASAFGSNVAVASALIGHGGVAQFASATNSTLGASATNVFNNNGVVEVHASAVAWGFATTGAGAFTGIAVANASADAVIQQSAFVGAGGFASVSFVNNGTVGAFAGAGVIGGLIAVAGANATGISQIASGGWTNLVSLHNNTVVTTAGSIPAFIGVQAVAGALAISGTAVASATALGIFQTAIASGGAISTASVTLVNNGDILVEATAGADGLNVAIAVANAIGIQQFADFASRAFDGITNGRTVNSGPAIISVLASAQAHGATTTLGGHLVNGIDVAVANVGSTGKAGFAISQQAWGNGNSTANATVSLLNQGVIHLEANAVATAQSIASAQAAVFGIYQSAWFAGTANANLTNGSSAFITASANAHAFASGISGIAIAAATAFGIEQGAWATSFGAFIGPQAHANITNDGHINVAANAFALASSIAVAAAGAIGISQSASASTSATNAVLNTNSIKVAAAATALAFGTAVATAGALGISQSAFGDPAIIAGFAGDFVTNEDLIDVQAHASASAGLAIAVAAAQGIFQSATSADFVEAFFSNTNSGAELHVSATAFAGSSGGGGLALAVAIASGVSQTVNVDSFTGVGLASIVNHGRIDVTAVASATAAGSIAFATAFAQGVFQHAGHALGTTTTSSIHGATAQLFNDGVVDVVATAFASGANAVANAFATGISQYVSASTTAGWGLLAHANVTNSNLINVSAHATASGFLGGGGAFAQAVAGGVFQTLTSAAFSGPAAFFASATVLNNGSIDPLAVAWAEGWTKATAIAIATGVSQSVIALSAAFANVTNNGNINATAIATAKAGFGPAFALAFASGVFQAASAVLPFGLAVANVFNGPGALINASAHASAHGASATALAFAFGISQNATVAASGIAAAAVFNSGTINAVATAYAKGGAAFASAVAGGITQSAGGFTVFAASNFVDNETGAVINVAAHATAIGYAAAGSVGGAPVAANATGISQSAWSTGFPGFFLNDLVTNEGSIHVSAGVQATGGIWAAASANAFGIVQIVANGVVAGAAAFNTGTLTVLASASAKTTTDAFGAVVSAHAVGISQQVGATGTGTIAGVAFAEVINGGTISVDANAHAVAPFWFATAIAGATGVAQGMFGTNLPSTSGPNEIFHNNGNFNVHASANATGATSGFGFASAHAQGLAVNGNTSPFLEVDIVNNGSSFHVEADAGGTGTGVAAAGGIFVVDAAASGDLYGAIVNNANMTVIASVNAPTGTAVAGGITVVANQFAPPGTAFTALISNTGVMNVKAIVSGTSNVAVATAIRVSALPGAAVATGTATIRNNSGTIFAGISFDGGATFLRGTAIETWFAPNAMNIEWMGSAHAVAPTGLIYGNVFMSTDDSITVSNGKTCFNGVINDPTLAVPHSFTQLGTTILATFANGAGGVLSIAANGTLVFVNDPVQGPAAAYVSTYNQAGTLVLELRGQDHTPAANSIGNIVVSNSANLGGALDIAPYAGLYTNAAYTIVSAPVGGINGTWASVNLPSVLLTASVTNNGTVAILNIGRVAFNAVPGLTHNEHAVATGIEHVYSTSLTGPFADLVSKLFLVGNAAEFANDMFQLSGVEHGEQAMASLNSVRMLNDTVGTHLQITSSGASDHVGQLIKGVSPAAGGTGIGKGNIWLSAYGNWGHLDASSSGPKANIADRGIFAGVDFDMDSQTRFGFVAGETSGRLRFQADNNNTGSYNGWHLGVYGRYDDRDSPWYVEGIGSWSMYSNDETRHISIDPSSGALCCAFPFGQASAHFGGTAQSRYDSHAASLRGEVGYNWDTGSAIDLTPYLALAWIHGGSDSFNERGLPGADLRVADATADSLATHLGIRLTTDWQISEHMLLSPVVRIAWEHEWEGTPWSVNESFADAPPGSNFTVDGTGYSRDFLDLGLALSANISGRVEAVIGYQGRWSSDQKDDSVLGRVNIHF